MKNFKQFSEELNEAVSTGYKEPVDLGAGWEKPVLSNSGFGAITARVSTRD